MYYKCIIEGSTHATAATNCFLVGGVTAYQTITVQNIMVEFMVEIATPCTLRLYQGTASHTSTVHHSVAIFREIFLVEHGTDGNFYSFRRDSVCFCGTKNTRNSVLSHSTEIKKAHNFVLNHFVEEKEFRSELLSIGKYCWKLIPNHSRTKKNIRMTLKKKTFFAEYRSVPNLGMAYS